MRFLLIAFAISFAIGAARADDARVRAALRAGDSGAAADALIEAANSAAGGVDGLTLTREGLRAALMRELEFFTARELRRGEPPSFAFAPAQASELQGGVRNACAAAADLEGERVTAQAFQTSAVQGAGVATCVFESQTEDAFRWTGVAFRTSGGEGLRIRAAFESRDAGVRRNAARRLSAILAHLTNAVHGPPPTRPPARRRPPPGTTI
jgi:hypothetical protein